MPSNEYLEKVTVGNVNELNGKITLCEYKDEWAEMFQRERNKIDAALNGNHIMIEHVGSTSVPGLCAKPILDILLLVQDSAEESAYVPMLERVGYVLKIREPDWYEHRLMKGAEPEVNLHVFSIGCEEAERMIGFRDWLRTHEDDREKYASVKRELAKKTWKYVQNYADSKSEVVAEIFRRIDSNDEERNIEEAIKFIKKIFENDFSGHDYFHSLRVYKTAVMIAEQEKADVEIVSLAALLHDVDDFKLSPDTYENKTNAVSFLEKQNVSSEMIVRICKIIDEVSFKGTDTVQPTSIEGKCVQDADRIDALGAIGIARAFAYGGSCNRAMHDPDIEPVTGMSGQQYQAHVSTTINHFYEKLFLLKDLMNTNEGKKIAIQREAFMREYLEEFMKEWEGADTII